MSSRKRLVVVVAAIAAAALVVVVAVLVLGRGGGGADRADEDRPTPTHTSPSPAQVAQPTPTGTPPASAPAGSSAPAVSPVPAPGPPDEVPEPAPAPDLPPPGDVTVSLTFAEWNSAAGTVEAAGFVSGIAAGTGTCTLELSAAGVPAVSTSVQAVADATTTACPLLSVPAGSLGSSAEVVAVLTYSSSSVAPVRSTPTTVRIG